MSLARVKELSVVVEGATVRVIKPHRLSRSDFVALAEGGGSKDLVDLLWRAERSRRLLLVKTLLGFAELNPDLLGSLPGVDVVWTALIHAEAARPEAVDRVLLHPQVGTALSYALRRVMTESSIDFPLWVDVGQVHTLGLVIAAGARLTWATEVPLRDGEVMLPGLGMARFARADRWDQAQAWTDGGRIWLARGGDEIAVPADPSTDARQWRGLRRLVVGAESSLTVWLDDLDPFRDFADPVPPAPLGPTGRRYWHALLAQAWRIIRAGQPELAEALAAGVTSIVPLPEAEGWDNRSASTGEAFGSVMLSPPSDPTALAISLVHEFQHIKLGGLLHLLTLTAPDEEAVLYAPWRDDPRPLGGLVQGAYAFGGIAAFWRGHRTTVTGTAARLAAFEYAYARSQTLEALRILQASTSLTPLGREFVDGMHDHLLSWLDDECVLLDQDLVELAADGHRAGWRIRHLRPDAADVSTVARAWLARDPAPPLSAATVCAHLERNWSRGRRGLIRRQILSPQRLGDALDGASWGETLTEADVDLVAGRSAARDGFLRELRAGPSNLDSWTGLGLALRRAKGGDADQLAATALLSRPEWVLAVHAELTAAGGDPPPVALASWLGASVTTGSPRATSSG